MKSDKIKVGQPIFLKPIGNKARGNRKVEIIEAIIATVGNKYFTVKNPSSGYIKEQEKFHIDSLIHNAGEYSPDYQCYLSSEEIIDEEEKKELTDQIRKYIGYAGPTQLNLHQCRLIIKVLEDRTL